MGNELLLIIGFTVFSLVVTMAWVGGYLDKYQQYVFPEPGFLFLDHDQILSLETCKAGLYLRSISLGLYTPLDRQN